ncbi:MAG: tryptophan synthase subunit alpha, partial [Oscillospiraceae bacterium]|nr:tryptophan synthase subunit alpha [Oscillospiraceae bacterium]
LGAIVQKIRENSDVPCAVGFGISNPEQAAKAAAVSDGVIVGSAIVKQIGEHGKDAAPVVGAFVGTMKQAITK